MSKAEKANQESDVFLQSVRLKNYKSIIDAEIDFKPGLNIIIGNNGSGKTNFLTYLYDVVDVNWDNNQLISSQFVIAKGSEIFKVNVEKKNNDDDLRLSDFDTDYSTHIKSNVKFYNGDKVIKEQEFTTLEFNYFLASQINYYTKQIQYGVPLNLNIVENPLQIEFDSNGTFPTVDTSNQTYFIWSVFNKLYYLLRFEKGFDTVTPHEVIKDLDVFLSNVRVALFTFTDIKDLRVSPNLNIYVSENNPKIGFHNLYLEFYLNGIWMPYTNLSDGTKRLLYIISNIISYSKIEILKSIDDNLIKDLLPPKYLILLEEPELGIHPHQLQKLMLFIREQSKTKQIILTTHSPQVLNILDADELDRIIICSYDQEKGTQLNHLTKKQIEKGQLYMRDEGFLSDYWVHSDLEPAS